LFLWHPILLLGFFGLIFYWKKDKYITVSFIFIFILQLMLNAAVLDWHAMWSFGHRRFISMLPIFIFGLTYLIEIAKHHLRYVYVITILFFSIWNQLFIFQYQKNLIFHDGNLTFHEFVVDKFKLPSVYKAHKLSQTAYFGLIDGDFKQFELLSKEAYELSPTSYKVFIIYALRSYFFDTYINKKSVYRQWYQTKPDLLIARWGLAEILISRNDYASALSLFDPGSIRKGSLESIIFNKVNARESIQMNQEFLNEFHSHFNHIYLQ